MNSSCIVTRGKQGKPFRMLAEHYNLSVPTLEIITYKYRNMVGNDAAFPSELFIRAEMGKYPYVEKPDMLKNAHKVWEAKYKEPLILSSEAELLQAKAKAETLFPKNAIHIYTDHQGRRTLSVQEPIAKDNLTIKDVLGRYTLDLQELSDFALIQASMGIPTVSLTEAQKTMVPELVNHLRTVIAPLGNKVHVISGLTEYFKNNPDSFKNAQMATQEPQYIEIDNTEEIEVLRHNLFNKFKEKSSYGCVGRTANFWYLCDYFGNSSYKIKAQIQIEGNENFLNDIEQKLTNRTYRDADSFVRRVTALASRKGQHHYGNVDVKILRGKATENALLDSSKIKSEQNTLSDTSDGQSLEDNAGTGLTISSDADWRNTLLQKFTTSQRIYGFVAPNGDIYLDETAISPEHPIHEYTHLWDRVIAQKKPELWKKGIELMKDPNLKFTGHDKTIWQEIEEDANYGGQWQRLKETNPSKYESLIASEVHAKLTGKYGLRELDKIAEKKEAKGIIAKLKEWMLDVWKELKATFSDWSNEDIQKLTLKDFVNMALRDFADGVNLNDNNTNTIQNGTDRTAEENKQFPSFLGNAGREKEASGVLAETAIYSRGVGKGTDVTEGFPKKQFLSRLETVAKQQGEWVEDISTITSRKSKKRGEESEIYLSKDGKSYIKLNNFNTLKEDYSIEAFVDRINSHNEFEPNASYTILGFTENSKGEPCIILQQPIIRGEEATQTEIDKYLTDAGFHREVISNGGEGWTNGVYEIWDANEKNVIKDNKGQLYFIDVIINNTQRVANYKAQHPEEDSTDFLSETPELSISHPVQLPNLGIETGERMVQVDQAWKEPVLQKLDSQLDTTTPGSEENGKIVEQIHRVLSATSQEDYEKAPTKQKEDTNARMSDYEKRNQQLNNLLDNEVGLQASEIRDTAETVMNTLSDIITEIQQHPERAKEYWPTLSSNRDISKSTRKQIVSDIIGINRLIALAKKRFDDLKWSEDPAVDLLYNSTHLLDQHDLIMANWDAVMRFAGDIFVANEGFGIKRNSREGNYEVEEREYVGYDYDDYSSPQDQDAVAEEDDEQEHWQVEAKTIDVVNSMSELVRMALHNCYVLDKNGNKMLDKWGMPKRVDKHKAVKQILYWTAGTLNLNEMIDRLEEHKDRNPWITQLTERLRDRSGKESDFQSQFYGVMHRHFQLYGIGQYENGKFVHKILNRHNALSEVMKGISAQFQMHQHPLFNRDTTINRESLNKLEGWYKELEELERKQDLADDDIEKASKTITAISRMLGFFTAEEEVLPIINKNNLMRMTGALRLMLYKEGLKAQAQQNTKDYKPFTFRESNNIRGALSKFLEPMIEELEETALNTIFEDGKMYQSNTIPSFLSQLFDSFAQEEDAFNSWVEGFYGNSQWFKKNDRWRTPWLALMMNNPEARKAFEHHVQLNFNKHNYMRNMSPEEYIISCITNYFFTTTDEKNPDSTLAWFRVPIQSNKPSNEFIKFFSYRGSDYKAKIAAAMQEFFLQELDRIDTVRKRAKQKDSPSAISNWDTQGRHFLFLPFLNSYLIDGKELVNKNGNDLFKNDDGTVNTEKNGELQKLLNKKLNAETQLSSVEDARLSRLVEEATLIYMQNKVDQILDTYERNGILKAAEKVENIKDSGRSIRENVENFLWNDFFAANNILQLTITDKAFYDSADNLQKRLSELHAPGTKANKLATDYEGNLVSDGTYRTIILKDFDSFVSSIIDNLTEVFNKKIAQAPESEVDSWIALRESLVGEKGRFRKINVTDAQAYSSPASYRKKAFMFGKWSTEAEDVYNRLRKGDFNLHDIEVAFQPLKPFVYGHVHKTTEVQNAPIQEMNVPFQAKNAEYLLIMAGALLEGQETSRPNLLRVLHNVMERSEQLFPTRGIDTIQFESAIKSGGQGIIDLNKYMFSPNGEAEATADLEDYMYVRDDKGKIVDYNYDTFVQSLDYDNYALQQEVPKHFQEHMQAEPSQKRANIMSDLDMWLNPQGEKVESNINYYTWKDPDGTEHKLTAQEFRKEYERIHAQNISESFDELSKMFHLDSLDKTERNIALSELLQEEIESSPRYGIDLMQACQIDPRTGDFRIPKGDPIQSKRIEQLINSIIKSRVNKQKLAGGPVVQVSNWGVSKQLHIRFSDKQGNILPTKEEYEAANPTGVPYKKFLEDNQAGIAHFEVYAPAAWKKHLEKFRNPDGSINLEAVEKCDPNLLRMITSRIPNEDKYSIAHGKIVGFMPEIAGDAIMFPYDLTEIDDSDFDVDKRYCHVFEIEDIVEDTPKIKELLFKAASDSYKKAHEGKEMSYDQRRKVKDNINMLLDNPEVMRHTDKTQESLYNAYQTILQTKFPYKVKYPKKGTRGDRNNQILNMDWAVMSNEMTASKILNPGGFEIPKHDAYVIAAYKATNGTIAWDTLEGMTTKELQKLMPADRDLAWFDTQVQFYKQNAAGSNLIGVFAVNKVAHAILEADDILIDTEDVCGIDNGSFEIAGFKFGGYRDYAGKPLMSEQEFKDYQEHGHNVQDHVEYADYIKLYADFYQTNRMSVDPSQDANGAYIGKTIGSMVGASADTAKDPWLDLIGINMTTAGIFNTLLRLGMPEKDAALFMAQGAIATALNEFNRSSLEEPTTLDAVINKRLTVLRELYGYADNSTIAKEPLTKEELRKGLLNTNPIGEDKVYKDKVDYKVLLAFSKLQKLAEAMRKPTLATRQNSISSAVGPLIIDNIILEHKLMQFLDVNSPGGKTGFYTSDGTIVDIDDIFYEHPMLQEFARAIDSRRPDCPTRILFADMPAGSSAFKAFLESIPDSIKGKIYDDRVLLSKLSDFYQSYMLVANGIIKPEHIGNYIKEFPAYFNAKKFKEKYPDNAFIQAIQTIFDRGAQRGYLSVNTTGMMEQEKEKLRMAWTDLHKTNPQLSTQLFTYAFFRGGIGFSPKTWMGLVPTYVKEHLTNQRADSAMTTYVDTYRHFPIERMVDSIILEQFVRNNWDNSKLVPKKGGEGTVYDYSKLSEGSLWVHAQKDKEALEGVQFMRTTVDKKTYLWSRITPMEDTESSIEFRRIMPLGNNGEYMEMSLDKNMRALEEVVELKDNNEQSELSATNQKETANPQSSSSATPKESVTAQAKSIAELVPLLMRTRNLTEKTAVDYLRILKEKVDKGTISNFSKQDIQRIANENGLNLNMEKALEWFKNLC